MAKSKIMKKIEKVAPTLTVIGGLNWGTVGLLNTNFVEMVAGNLAVYVYATIGVAAVLTTGSALDKLKK